MEFNVNRADPGLPAKHGPNAQKSGLLTTQPLLKQKASAAAYPGDPQLSTVSRRTNYNPDPAREPRIPKSRASPLEKGGENQQRHPEPEREVGRAGCCVFLLLWWCILLNFSFSFPTYVDGQHIKPWPVLIRCVRVERHPCTPQTTGFMFGSSLEPSLKAGLRCQGFAFLKRIFSRICSLITKDQVCS